MPFAVELFFDLNLDEEVRRIWAEASKAAGVSNRMADTENKPHISLAVFQDCDVKATTKSLREMANKGWNIEIDLNSIGIFSSQEGVLFLAPVVTQALQKIHLDCQARLRDLSEGMWPYYLPDRLAFHCTVNTGLDPEEINKAISAVKKLGLPKSGKATELGLVRIPEMEFIETYRLR